MGTPADRDIIFLEATFRRALRIWWAWFWRWAVLGGTPVALAGSLSYCAFELGVDPALGSAIFPLTELLAVVALFWAYTRSFQLIFGKNLGGFVIRLQTNSSTFLTPTPFLIRKIRKKWARRSRRWGQLGFLLILILFGVYIATVRLERPTAVTTEPGWVMSWVVGVALLLGVGPGWLFGTLLELKSIFNEDFGEFKVYLTWQPLQAEQHRASRNVS
jgi:hypothetical protein